MQPDRMITTLVEFTVQKGLRDIRQEPYRGTRNLLEFGGMFTNEALHLDIIDYLRERLRNSGSGYYDLMERIAMRADPAIVSTLLADLGYHALTYGAGVIRETEQQAGFLVPWCLTVETAGDPDSTAHLRSLILQGNDLGIYGYVVRPVGDGEDATAVIEALGERRDSACLLLLDPEQLTGDGCKAIQKARNCLPLINLDTNPYETRALLMLRTTGCIYGVYSRRAHMIAGDRNNMVSLSELGVSLLVQVDPGNITSDFAQNVYAMINALRDDLTLPILPVDLYGDILRTGRYVVGEPALAFVAADGGLTTVGSEPMPGDTPYDTHSQPLRTIFSRALAVRPRRIDPA